MNRNVLAALLIASCFLISGCGDSHDKVMKDGIREMKNLITVLESIETKEDAEAARGKLEGIQKRLTAISKRAEKMGKPDAATDKKLKEKYKSQIEELGPKMMGVAFKLGSKPEISKVLDETMKGMNDMPGF